MNRQWSIGLTTWFDLNLSIITDDESVVHWRYPMMIIDDHSESLRPWMQLVDENWIFQPHTLNRCWMIAMNRRIVILSIVDLRGRSWWMTYCRIDKTVICFSSVMQSMSLEWNQTYEPLVGRLLTNNVHRIFHDSMDSIGIGLELLFQLFLPYFGRKYHVVWIHFFWQE